jgi:hypothetical protein
VWAYDFVHDVCRDGRKLKILTVADEFTRRCLAVEVERRMPAGAVCRVLLRLERVKPHPDFSLNRQPNGQPCKRIKVHLRYHCGVVGTATGFTLPMPALDELGNRFLERELKRHEPGQLCLESYLDLHLRDAVVGGGRPSRARASDPHG